ncbi:MAG: glycosyltransferase family 2 protein [Phycisphaerales bacterium]|nr:MAG: glycosyltransferase family 2 protein [Phycisphaerales bacterium]
MPSHLAWAAAVEIAKRAPYTNAMKDVTIVIVSYNVRDLLRDCLASIPSGCQGLITETFVVDNASSDRSAEMVSREFPWARLLHNENNAGFAAANNVGLCQATGRYVLLLNPDTRLRPSAVFELVRFMDARPSAGYCGPRLLNGDTSHQPSARRLPTLFSTAYSLLGLSSRFPKSRHALDLHLLHGHTKDFRADWLTGACLLVRASCVRQVGALDPGFFLYFEETDWCRRMLAAGWTGWFVHRAEVVHLGGRSVSHAGATDLFFGNHPIHWIRSSRRYFRRQYGLLGMLWSEFVQLLLYSLIWLRHRWQRKAESRLKARRAAGTIRYLLFSRKPKDSPT